MFSLPAFAVNCPIALGLLPHMARLSLSVVSASDGASSFCSSLPNTDSVQQLCFILMVLLQKLVTLSGLDMVCSRYKLRPLHPLGLPPKRSLRHICVKFTCSAFYSRRSLSPSASSSPAPSTSFSSIVFPSTDGLIVYLEGFSPWYYIRCQTRKTFQPCLKFGDRMDQAITIYLTIICFHSWA